MSGSGRIRSVSGTGPALTPKLAVLSRVESCLDGGMRSSVAKHKALQSVVNSFVASFTSLMNYSGNDYVMGHILTAARETGKARLDVDLLSGHIEPEEFRRNPIVSSVAYRCADFPKLVERSGSDPAFVATATMSIEFDIETEQPVRHAPHLRQSPFVCTVAVTDDRGRTYQAVRKDWWYPEGVHKVTSRFIPRPPGEPPARWRSRLLRFFKRFT